MIEGAERTEALKQIREQVSSEEILEEILKGLEEKQIKEPCCIRIDEVSSIADYMLFTTITSSTHMKVVASEIQKLCKKAGFQQLNAGEKADADWTLLDFGSVILHLLSKTARDHYKLEKMWAQGETISLNHRFPEESS
ncbi:ribosome silencing factor [bacterium]|jgi:ribosome-associated protein|nr:ribosome silencing factor [bacterium]